MEPNRKGINRAILEARCPRCRQGRMFPYSVWDIKNLSNMNKRCSDCGQSFEPEPGFYFGAMFVAYGLNVILAISTWLFLYFIFRPEFRIYVIVIIVINILLVPFLFRYSRVLFLYGFGGIQFNKNVFNLKQ